MKSCKLWSTVVDYFLILSAIIGVGFASGKEIGVFFFNFGKMSIVSLLCFGLLYVYLFFVISYVKNKLSLNSYNDFNAKIFGSLSKFCTIVMLVNFAITSAGMLAGADYLFKTFFGVGHKIPSMVLSVITFCLLLGGIEKIKSVANFIIPVMIATIVLNSIGNINPTNVHFDVCNQSSVVAVFYGLLFGVNNFVAALPILFEVKLKSKGKLLVILTICLIILLNILMLASNNFSTDMPMFELSKNISVSFYYIYFATLVLALFSTLMICSYNMQTILFKNQSSFGAGVVVLFNLILSQVGYNFIVQYLYVASGMISAIFVVLMIVMIVVKLLCKNKKMIILNIPIYEYMIRKNDLISRSYKNKNKYLRYKNN